MKNAIVYLRRSTKKEEQDKSIPDQLAEVKAQAGKENCHLVEELLYRYIDDGISGRSKKDRQGFLQILEDAKSGLFRRYKIEVVLYWATDRLARNTLNALEIQDELEEYGITLYSVTERYDLSTEAGRIQFIMCSMFAEERSNQISRDTKRGLKQKAMRGEFGCPVPPIGYRRDKDKNLIIDKDEAYIVKRIFELAGEGLSAYAIAKEFNKQGMVTPKGNCWTRKMIITVLRNRLYIGEIVYGRSYSTRKGKKVFRPKEQWQAIEGKHKAIIERNIFEKAHRLLDKRAIDRNFISQRNNFYLLSGLGILKCGCGAAFIGHTLKQNISGKDYYYYRYECSGRKTGKGRCGMPSVKCSILDSIVLNDIKSYVEDPERLKKEYQRNYAVIYKNTESLKSRLFEIEGTLKGIENKIDRLLQGYESGIIQLEDYERRSKRLIDARFQHQVQKLELESLLHNGSKPISGEDVIKQLRNFLKIWNSGTDIEKKMQVKELVCEIIIEGKNKFRIKYNFLP
jgi:site-specific DNA recombinase